MLQGRKILSHLQRSFLQLFAGLPDQEYFYLTGGTMAELARQKDPGFDLYWFSVALNRTAKFPDEIERWPVKMLVDCDPVELKRSFGITATDIMAKQAGQG